MRRERKIRWENVDRSFLNDTFLASQRSLFGCMTIHWHASLTHKAPASTVALCTFHFPYLNSIRLVGDAMVANCSLQWCYQLSIHRFHLTLYSSVRERMRHILNEDMLSLIRIRSKSDWTKWIPCGEFLQSTIGWRADFRESLSFSIIDDESQIEGLIFSDGDSTLTWFRGAENGNDWYLWNFHLCALSKASSLRRQPHWAYLLMLISAWSRMEFAFKPSLGWPSPNWFIPNGQSTNDSTSIEQSRLIYRSLPMTNLVIIAPKSTNSFAPIWIVRC